MILFRNHKIGVVFIKFSPLYLQQLIYEQFKLVFIISDSSLITQLFSAKVIYAKGHLKRAVKEK